ncbi:beta-ketoacyl synthase chain length factor [Dyella mobilis]|uniref:Beta-ketoacyl synthase chain length factor n=1 Tax=Dyella mobilis TaxID=1849582 RepID=A0ABS2KLD0_9GAMM|nr:beta-ketoacyl synthase chain length factor [Dyella mobilis]MBM7131894.1 beta-ketoacyl synthase chain length factor [Dyella mobilis]GLQ96123.1 3-oxoacyl-ACP synthase [Dyella mobilis]
MNFVIEQWRAWAPGLDSDEAWQAWSRHPVRVPDDDARPACDFLPAMQRRRLSRLARMTLHVAWPLCAEDEQLPFVFASRHGETPRTYALLSEVADQQPLSPTQFGLSVHNAIAGQWSILRGQRGESVAIAGEADTFEHAMVEAAALLSEGAPAVLVVIAEEYPPEPYREWIDDVPFSYALALRVRGIDADHGMQTGERWQLRLEPDDHHHDAASECPHALQFVRAMHEKHGTLDHSWKARRWIWQRIP